MKTLFCLIFSLIAFFSLRAGTYYVSAGGDNNHSGTGPEPWETLQYAVDQLSPGDTLFVLAGDYVGFNMDDNMSGESDNPIAILAYPGARIISRCTDRPSGINIEGTNYIHISGFTIRNTDGSITDAGIRSVINTGVVIKNNNIDGMGSWGILTGFSENIIIEYNSCSNSADEHGIYFSNSADNPIIRYNTCFSNNGCGIHMNGDINNSGPNLDGIITNALVEGNIIYDNNGGSGINMDGVQNSIVRNNLLYNNHTNSGIAVFHIDGAEGSKNNLFLNNTIIMASDGGWAININTDSDGAKVYNNILFNLHSYRGGLSIDQDCLTGFASDYNIMIDRLSTNWGDNVINLDTWKIQTGQDMNSITSTPNEIFVSANDYHLAIGCDAIDFATDIYPVTLDLERRSRPAGITYDAGAYEYNAQMVALHYSTSTDFFIIPNPAIDNFTLESKTPVMKIEIIDEIGKVIGQFSGNSEKTLTISSKNWSCGLYFIRILDAHNNSSTRILMKK